MSERRATARRRTFLQGVLSFQNGNSSEDCIVRDLGDGGAQIELPHPHAREAFDLRIPARDLHATAEVAWRNGVRAGLRFAAVRAATPKPARTAQRDEGY